jgi:hypothetical protein
MEDFKKLGWIIFNFIIYSSWVALTFYLNKLTGLDELDSTPYIIFFFLFTWVGGIFVVVFAQDYLSRIIK